VQHNHEPNDIRKRRLMMIDLRIFLPAQADVGTFYARR